VKHRDDSPVTEAGSVADRAEPAPQVPRRGMREDDLLRFVWIADPQISPDGGRVAFCRVWIEAEADEYRTQIWIANTAGGEPRPLTAGHHDSQPRWSPDGERLAFVRRPAAGKPGQLHLLPMDGGEGIALTSLEGGASEPAWSPDGARLAFLSPHHPALDTPERKKPKHEPSRVVTRPVFRENESGFIDHQHRDHVWVVERAGGAPRPLTCGPLTEGAPRWSRDGRWILFASDRREEPWFGLEESKIYAVACDLDAPTDGAALQRVVDMTGPLTAWTEAPDGRIAMLGALAREPRSYDQPGLLMAAGAWPRSEIVRVVREYDFPFGEGLTSDQHPPRGGGQTPLAFTAEGAVIARVIRHGSSLLARVEPATGKVEELTPAGLDIVCGTATPDGERWALTIGTPGTPGDLYGFDARTGSLRKLWGPNDAWLGEVALGEVEEFWYPSFDGLRIQGWIVKPPSFDPGRPHPLVLEIHGGPHAAYGMGFFHEFQVLAAAGYVVLYTNPRGSTGYGQEFANVIQYRFPGDDARDLMAGVDAVIARGLVDESRLGVTGGSGGGLLTNWLVTRTDRFAAAITQRCVSDWPGMYYSCDFTMFMPFWFRQPPWEDPEDYRQRSPVAHVERITTPLMVLHSEEDWRTPIAQGEAMFRALKHRRMPTVMVRFPGENHELSRSGAPSRRVQNQEHIRRWLDRWLLGKPAPEYGV
jgi:dipeptidyl aminopeptidase/acylaminoacyl peptidase